MNYKLDHILQQWGKEQRRAPENNDATKALATSALKVPEEKVVMGHPIRIPWLALASTGLAVVIFFVQNTPSPAPMRKFQTTQSGAGASFKNAASSSSLGFESVSSLPSLREPVIDYFRPVPTPASDTREFLKTDYHATIKTRRVEEIGNRIQTIVRGYGGRIDSSSIQTRYAYLSFVVPKKTFDAFKVEIKTLLPARFITESSATQNLLPEKRVIEEKTEMMHTLLAEHKKNRDTLETRHRATVASLQKQLNAVVAEIRTLQSEVTTDPVRQKQINDRIAILQAEQRRLNRNLANENAQYVRERDMLDAQIRDAESEITNLDKRDNNLIENVETVQGSITIEWISILKIIGLYMPKDWLSFLFLGFALLAFLSYRRRRMAIELP